MSGGVRPCHGSVCSLGVLFEGPLLFSPVVSELLNGRKRRGFSGAEAPSEKPPEEEREGEEEDASADDCDDNYSAC